MSVNTGICNFSESVQHPFVRKMVMLSWRESAMVWYVVITSWGSFWFFSSLLRKGPSLKAIHCFIKTNSLRIKHKAILLKTHLLLSTQTNIQFAKCCSVPFLQHTLIFAIYWKALAPEQVFLSEFASSLIYPLTLEEKPEISNGIGVKSTVVTGQATWKKYLH